MSREHRAITVGHSGNDKEIVVRDPHTVTVLHPPKTTEDIKQRIRELFKAVPPNERAALLMELYLDLMHQGYSPDNETFEELSAQAGIAGNPGRILEHGPSA